jgi:sRNA-binding regulator protein Hfq
MNTNELRYWNALAAARIPVRITLQNGAQRHGIILWHEDNALLLEQENKKSSLICKAAIAEVEPLCDISLAETHCGECAVQQTCEKEESK